MKGAGEETGVTEASPGRLPAADRMSAERDGPEDPGETPAPCSPRGLPGVAAVADSCFQPNPATSPRWIPAMLKAVKRHVQERRRLSRVVFLSAFLWPFIRQGT